MKSNIWLRQLKWTFKKAGGVTGLVSTVTGIGWDQEEALRRWCQKQKAEGWKWIQIKKDRWQLIDLHPSGIQPTRWIGEFYLVRITGINKKKKTNRVG